jgi:hypothetical protein
VAGAPVHGQPVLAGFDDGEASSTHANIVRVGAGKLVGGAMHRPETAIEGPNAVGKRHVYKITGAINGQSSRLRIDHLPDAGLGALDVDEEGPAIGVAAGDKKPLVVAQRSQSPSQASG